ncbi:MAG: RluA family pseudouridine synthase [Acholeplasmataceae bacterium]
MNFIYFEVKKDQTIKAFLESFYVSKKTIYKQELFNLLRVEDQVRKLSFPLKKGDVLQIKLAPLDGVIKPYKGVIEIVYEDEDVLIVNKPSGILIHEDGNTFNTLTNIVNYHFQTRGYDCPVLPVHRLDFDTSGLVLFAKHFLALSYLSRQFEDQNVKKKYIALCEGIMNKHYDTLDYPIGRDRHSNKYIVYQKGKPSRTQYQVIDQFDNKTKCEVYIKGGRTHQIRVHFSYIGHPIVGDKLYSKSENNRLHLHFNEIEFIHPRNQKKVKFSTGAPF